MATPTSLIECLVRDEGLKLTPYVDTVGKVTIGVGRNLTDVGISHDEALTLLMNDIAKAQAFVRTKLPWSLNIDRVRCAVLENMCFNMGIEKLLEFHHMLAAMQGGDWPTAATQGRASLWHKEVGDRAERLMKQLESGEWV